MRWIGQQLYDATKDRRYGTLFLFSVVNVFGLTILVAWVISLKAEHESINHILAVISIFFALWLIALFWPSSRRRSKVPNCSRLSPDELAKARGQLLKSKGRT
jgi:uncharacterized membrane protein YqjE